MPGLPTIADTYRVALVWNLSGQSAVNVMHFLRSSTTAAVIASTLDSNVTAAMWGSVWPTATVNHIAVTPLDGSSATYTLNTSGAKWTGSAAAGDPTIAVAAIVKLTTSLRGRSNRGRLYLPGTCESVQNGGTLVAGTVTSMQTAWNNFLTAMVAAGQQPVVASYLHATQHPVAAFTVETFLATQRRRQGRIRA
jgi:hypothetical protein